MKKDLLNLLVCPLCNNALTGKDLIYSSQDNIWFGKLFCDKCNKNLAEINYGRADFLRSNPGISSSPSLTNLYYKRFGWHSPIVKYENCDIVNFGWNAEGYSGSLKLSPESKITISINALEIGLRFLTGKNCGKASIAIDSETPIIIDLNKQSEKQIESWRIYSSKKPLNKIVITAESDEQDVYFFGIDAGLEGNAKTFGGNRGNGFPKAYKYLLDNLPDDALFLDCGSGDRQYPDKRVIAFEYMDFELPSIFGDSHTLPFKSNSFDVVFSQAVMEHMEDPYQAAQEISRVLKPGGLVYCESAFMQPLHGVPYHFFNTTPEGLNKVFLKANILPLQTEWFGSLFTNMEWIVNGVNLKMNFFLRKFFLWWMNKIHKSINYNNLKAIASGVSFFGQKLPENSSNKFTPTHLLPPSHKF